VNVHRRKKKLIYAPDVSCLSKSTEKISSRNFVLSVLDDLKKVFMLSCKVAVDIWSRSSSKQCSEFSLYRKEDATFNHCDDQLFDAV
jgi:hypothetical protein